MSLMKKKVEFDVLGTIRNLQEVSAYKKTMADCDARRMIDLMFTMIGFGRQAGHTTAVKELLVGSTVGSRSKRPVIVITNDTYTYAVNAFSTWKSNITNLSGNKFGVDNALKVSTIINADINPNDIESIQRPFNLSSHNGKGFDIIIDLVGMKGNLYDQSALLYRLFGTSMSDVNSIVAVGF